MVGRLAWTNVLSPVDKFRIPQPWFHLRRAQSKDGHFNCTDTSLHLVACVNKKSRLNLLLIRNIAKIGIPSDKYQKDWKPGLRRERYNFFNNFFSVRNSGASSGDVRKLPEFRTENLWKKYTFPDAVFLLLLIIYLLWREGSSKRDCLYVLTLFEPPQLERKTRDKFMLHAKLDYA